MNMRKIIFLCAVVTISLSLTTANARTYLIEYQRNNNELVSSVTRAGGTITNNWPQVKIAVVQSNHSGFEAAMRKDLNIQGIAPDVRLQWTPKARTRGKQRLTSAQKFSATGSPFDAGLLGAQWNLSLTQAIDAWDITQGHPAVKVAVLDTGYCSHHVDTSGKLDTVHSAAFIAETHPACTAAVAACPTCPAWEDYNFHGTHVASIISSNNIGTASVAPNITLRAVKVLDCTGNGGFENVIAGTLYAVATGNDVINLSLGLPIPKNAGPGTGFLIGLLNKVANYANRRGVLIVTASGNDSIDLDHDRNIAFVPCQSGSGLCVGATDENDVLTVYSNHGVSGPQIVAPGGGGTSGTDYILSVCAPHQAVLPFSCGSTDYVFAAGTSQATPHVSGTAALIDSMAPRGPGSRSPAQLRSKILQGADDLGAPDTDNLYSHGRLNTQNSLD